MAEEVALKQAVYVLTDDTPNMVQKIFHFEIRKLQLTILSVFLSLPFIEDKSMQVIIIVANTTFLYDFLARHFCGGKKGRLLEPTESNSKVYKITSWKFILYVIRPCAPVIAATGLLIPISVIILEYYGIISFFINVLTMENLSEKFQNSNRKVETVTAVIFCVLVLLILVSKWKSPKFVLLGISVFSLGHLENIIITNFCVGWYPEWYSSACLLYQLICDFFIFFFTLCMNFMLSLRDGRKYSISLVYLGYLLFAICLPAAAVHYSTDEHFTFQFGMDSKIGLEFDQLNVTEWNQIKLFQLDTTVQRIQFVCMELFFVVASNNFGSIITMFSNPLKKERAKNPKDKSAGGWQPKCVYLIRRSRLIFGPFLIVPYFWCLVFMGRRLMSFVPTVVIGPVFKNDDLVALSIGSMLVQLFAASFGTIVKKTLVLYVPILATITVLLTFVFEINQVSIFSAFSHFWFFSSDVLFLEAEGNVYLLRIWRFFLKSVLGLWLLIVPARIVVTEMNSFYLAYRFPLCLGYSTIFSVCCFSYLWVVVKQHVQVKLAEENSTIKSKESADNKAGDLFPDWFKRYEDKSILSLILNCFVGEEPVISDRMEP
ncbi:hypothetical protein L596_021706 [Steinernema carpocapsae]|uniref:Uncharacterized protein n=1 Tax=Steinernema carpocapsae TaxID=34508 RepID=A0A4U5MJJ6_STECR|nr:hypothetical protein L596_021706 [Steinernema carpocapsae]